MPFRPPAVALANTVPEHPCLTPRRGWAETMDVMRFDRQLTSPAASIRWPDRIQHPVVTRALDIACDPADCRAHKRDHFRSAARPLPPVTNPRTAHPALLRPARRLHGHHLGSGQLDKSQTSTSMAPAPRVSPATSR